MVKNIVSKAYYFAFVMLLSALLLYNQAIFICPAY